MRLAAVPGILAVAVDVALFFSSAAQRVPASIERRIPAAVAGGVYLWIHESVASLQLKNDRYITQIRNSLVPPHGPTTALVLGYDHRAGEGGLPSRSDTMMLLRTDPASKTVTQLSFPRDLEVE